MSRKLGVAMALAAVVSAAALASERPTNSDAEIAHIAYTAGKIDIAAGRQALTKSKNPDLRLFAEDMIRDHMTVNGEAMALVKKLGVTPRDNPTSMSLSAIAANKLKEYETLTGADFDRAYIRNEIAFHKSVNGALSGSLIASAKNAELKALLQTGLSLFQAHQSHAEHMAAVIR